MGRDAAGAHVVAGTFRGAGIDDECETAKLPVGRGSRRRSFFHHQKVGARVVRITKKRRKKLIFVKKMCKTVRASGIE